jgi:Tfp pilus assembly protein PilF
MAKYERRRRNRLRLIPWVCGIIVIALCANADSPRPTNQDYYAVAGSEELMKLLDLVDKFHTNKIFNAIMEKNYGQAKDDLDYTLHTFPNHPEALQLLILYARARGSGSFAKPYFERAVQLYPQYPMTHVIYGIFLTNFGILKEAVRELKMALEIEPNLTPAYVWLAKAYDKAGNTEEARKSAQKAVEMGYRGNLLDDLVKRVP